MTTANQFLEVPVAHLLEAADKKARETGDFNQHTMRGIGGRQVGFLGELVVMEHFDQIGIPYEPKFTLKHDIEIIMPDGEKLLEVKTKERTVVPREEYECSVPKYVKDYQAVDFYIFVSLLSTGKSENINRFTKAFILGTISRKKFEEQATLWTTNKTDATNNWTPTIDVWNVPISSLKPPYQKVGAI
jgi:hypothetical protein